MKLSLTILFLALSISISAKTVDIKDYATPNDDINDAYGFQNAVNDLRLGGGGTLLISDGVWNLSSRVDFVDYGNYVSYKLQGDKGAVIKVGGGPAGLNFHIGNVNQFEMRDLIFIGNPAISEDTGILLIANYTSQLHVTGCQFFGIRSKNRLFEIGNTDAVFENNQFDGSGADNAVIYATPLLKSIVLRNNTFLDYANFRNVYYSKPGGSAWVLVDADPNQPVNANTGPTVTIDGARFDEGATEAVRINHARNVQIRNIAVNVNGTDIGRGVVMNNVRNAVFEDSVLGFTNNPRIGLTLNNNSRAKVSRLSFGGGVIFSRVDETSELLIIDCPDCEKAS